MCDASLLVTLVAIAENGQNGGAEGAQSQWPLEIESHDVW